MSEDSIELFWSLLDWGKYDEARRNIPKSFSFKMLHPTKKLTVLIAAYHAPLAPDRKQGESCLELIEWLIRSGASLSQKCGFSTNFARCNVWKKQDEENTKLSVEFKGHSFLSWIDAWKKQFRGKPEWKDNLDYLDKIIDRISKATSQLRTRPRASVDEGIVEIWEKSLLATASHDLTIEASDGSVTAHAHMLVAASPVVQAMLGSPMKERWTQQIQLKDTSSGAVTLFLEALYTCSSLGDPDYKTALSALDLAHRWQVEAVVAILADLIGGLITEESFPSIAEHAALKGLDTLKKACQNFGSQNAAIQEQIGKGTFPNVVQDLFSNKATSQPVKKRKRL